MLRLRERPHDDVERDVVCEGWRLSEGCDRGSERQRRKAIPHAPRPYLRTRTNGWPHPSVAINSIALAPASSLTRSSPSGRGVGWQRKGEVLARVGAAFFRYKTILGDGLQARTTVGRAVESVLVCNVLNRITALGRPQSFAIGRRRSLVLGVV